MADSRSFKLARSRMRLPLAAIVLALGLAGCGGSQIDYEEVPGGPAEITLPESSTAGDAAAEDSATDDSATGEATPTPTATAETGASTGTTDTTEDTSAGTDAPATEDGPDSDQPPAPGSDAERFEDFCEQNAGAC
jgi:hypothetical protein